MATLDSLDLKPLPSGLWIDKPPLRPIDVEFATAAKQLRFVKDDQELLNVLAELKKIAKGDQGGAPDPFQFAPGMPSAFHLAVSTGRVSALDMMSHLAGLERVRLRINDGRVDGTQDTGFSEIDGQTYLRHAWLARTNPHDDGGSNAVVRRLLELGAHPDGNAMAPGDPLACVVHFGHLRAAAALIEHGASLHFRTGSDRNTPLHIATARSWPSEALHDLLLAAGCDPEAHNRYGFTALEAAHEGQDGWVGQRLAAKDDALAIEKSCRSSSPSPRRRM